MYFFPSNLGGFDAEAANAVKFEADAPRIQLTDLARERLAKRDELRMIRARGPSLCVSEAPAYRDDLLDTVLYGVAVNARGQA
jgi:hypothetical protein